MPSISITKNWDDGAVLSESNLDDIKNSIETFLNTTKIDNANIQTGGIATANYAAGSVDAAAIGSSAVTTAKINDGAVTQAKRASLGQQVSSSSSNFSTTSTSLTDVTNLSVSITTTGRPVFVGVQSDGTGVESYWGSVATDSVTYVAARAAIIRGSTEVARAELATTDGTSSASLTVTGPPGSLWCIDAPSAGTYTYKVRILAGTNNSARMYYSKLVAYEL